MNRNTEKLIDAERKTKLLHQLISELYEFDNIDICIELEKFIAELEMSKIKFRAVLDDKELGVRIVNVQSIEWLKERIIFNDGTGIWFRHFSTIKAILPYIEFKDKNNKKFHQTLLDSLKENKNDKKRNKNRLFNTIYK